MAQSHDNIYRFKKLDPDELFNKFEADRKIKEKSKEDQLKEYIKMLLENEKTLEKDWDYVPYDNYDESNRGAYKKMFILGYGPDIYGFHKVEINKVLNEMYGKLRRFVIKCEYIHTPGFHEKYVITAIIRPK
jgi:hypothetical protein